MSEPKRILLVDDDPDIIEANKALLESEGYEIYSAMDGKSGLEVAQDIKPDLMILDVMMAHDTEGFDVSRDLPKIPELQNLPVIILTGIREAMSLPFKFEPDGTWLPVKVVLEKPVAPETLLEEVKKHIA